MFVSGGGGDAGAAVRVPSLPRRPSGCSPSFVPSLPPSHCPSLLPAVPHSLFTRSFGVLRINLPPSLLRSFTSSLSLSFSPFQGVLQICSLPFSFHHSISHSFSHFASTFTALRGKHFSYLYPSSSVLLFLVLQVAFPPCLPSCLPSILPSLPLAILPSLTPPLHNLHTLPSRLLPAIPCLFFTTKSFLVPLSVISPSVSRNFATYKMFSSVSITLHCSFPPSPLFPAFLPSALLLTHPPNISPRCFFLPFFT